MTTAKAATLTWSPAINDRSAALYSAAGADGRSYRVIKDAAVGWVEYRDGKPCGCFMNAARAAESAARHEGYKVARGYI